MADKNSGTEDKKPVKTPGPNDSDQCWQCQHIISPGLGMDMLPEEGGYCVCKGWTEDVFGDACELFRKKYGQFPEWGMDRITRETWDNLNKM